MNASARLSLLCLCILILLGAPAIGRADSVWRAGPTGEPHSLYSTSKGEYRIGDIITILIIESVNASNSAGLNTDKKTQTDAGIQGFDDFFGMNHLFGRPVSADPQFGVNAENKFDSGGASHRSSAITGTISGQITEILPNGNLRIEASQSLLINDEKNMAIIIGTIRPQDVSPQNTILSSQVSNAEIRYEGRGPLSTQQKRGIITEVLEYIWPF